MGFAIQKNFKTVFKFQINADHLMYQPYFENSEMLLFNTFCIESGIPGSKNATQSYFGNGAEECLKFILYNVIPAR